MYGPVGQERVSRRGLAKAVTARATVVKMIEVRMIAGGFEYLGLCVFFEVFFVFGVVDIDTKSEIVLLLYLLHSTHGPTIHPLVECSIFQVWGSQYPIIIVTGGRHRNSKVASFLRASILPAYRRTQSLPCEAHGRGPGQHEVSVPFSLKFQTVRGPFAIPGVNDGVDDSIHAFGGIDCSINNIKGFDGSFDGSIDSIESMNISLGATKSNVDQIFNPSNRST